MGVFVMEFFLPLQLKLSVYEVCRPYLYQLEAKGSLEEDQLEAMVSSLEAKGLVNVRVTVDQTGLQFGDELLFNVEGDYIYQPMVSLFKRQGDLIHYAYKKRIKIRRIVN